MTSVNPVIGPKRSERTEESVGRHFEEWSGAVALADCGVRGKEEVETNLAGRLSKGVVSQTISLVIL